MSDFDRGALVRRFLPAGEELWQDILDVEAYLPAREGEGDGRTVLGEMAVGLRRTFFVAEERDGFGRHVFKEPIAPLRISGVEGPFTRFFVGRSVREYRADETTVEQLQEQVANALELRLVEVGPGRWAVRRHAFYDGSTQRAAYINVVEADGLYYNVDSHTVLQPDDPSMVAGPFYSPQVAFDDFVRWYHAILSNPD